MPPDAAPFAPCSLRGSTDVTALCTLGKAKTREEACWALAVVESRAVTLGDGSPSSPWRLALCPLIDLLNHKAGSGAACSFMDVPERGVVELSANGPLSRGDELTITYEDCSSAQIFARYGFVQQVPQSGAPPESCVLEVPIADHLQLPGGVEARDLRVELIRAAGWRRSAWRPLLLKMPDNASAGGSLLAIARLAVLPSAEALHAFGVQVINGRRLAPMLESTAREQAQAWLEDAIARIDSNIEHLENGLPSWLETRFPNGVLSEAVRNLLQAERAVLRRSVDMFAKSLAQ